MTNARDEKFQTWWNKRYFDSTLPFFRTYKQLFCLGADLDYIDFLKWVLAAGQCLREKFEKVIREKFKSRPKRRDTIDPEIYLFFFERLPQEDQRAIFTDPIFTDLFRLKARSFSTPAEMARSLSSYLKQRPQSDFMTYLVGKYGSLEKMFQHKGNRPDTWGTFYLLAFTEHMREQSKKPHYLEAARLLSELRACSFSKEMAHSVRSRVYDLTKSYPDWREDVKLLKKVYTELYQVYVVSLS